MNPLTAHLTDDELVDLVNELLGEASRARVIAHASECAECDRRLAEFASVHERGRARAAQILSAAPAPERGRSRAARRMPGPAVLAAAAALVAVAGWFATATLRIGSSPAERARQVWLPREADLVEGRRGEGTPQDSAVMAGIAAYDRRDLAGAERLLSAPVSDYGIEWLRRLYLSNVELAMGRNDAALGLLSGFRGDFLPEPWRGELQWSLMVTLARSHRPAAADSMFQILRAREDAIGDRARRLAETPR